MLSAGAAGCLGDSTDTGRSTDPTDETQQAAPPSTLAFGGCQEQLGAWEGMDYDTVAPYLPEGFHPDGFVGDDNTGRNVTFYLIGFVCTEPRDAAVLFPWIPAIPPDEHINPEAFYHAVSLPCIADPVTTEVLRAWGAPCTPGELGIQPQAHTPAGAAWTFSAENPNTTIRLQGSGPATDLPAGPELIPMFQTADGQLCAVIDALIGVHEHWQEGPSTLEVTGEVGFPVPSGPGSGLLAPGDLTLELTHVSTPPPATGAGGTCPGGTGSG